MQRCLDDVFDFIGLPPIDIQDLGIIIVVFVIIVVIVVIIIVIVITIMITQNIK